MTAVVLQARMGSTRLPGKALLPLGGSTLVEQAMARLALVPAEARVLATDEASGPPSRPQRRAADSRSSSAPPMTFSRASASPSGASASIW